MDSDALFILRFQKKLTVYIFIANTLKNIITHFCDDDCTRIIYYILIITYFTRIFKGK